MVPVCMFRNGCIENYHFFLQRCDWLERLREYAVSNQQCSCASSLELHALWYCVRACWNCMLFSQMLANQIAGKQIGNFLCNHSEVYCRFMNEKIKIKCIYIVFYSSAFQRKISSLPYSCHLVAYRTSSSQSASFAINFKS